MATLAPGEMQRLLRPYLSGNEREAALPPDLYEQLSVYLDLILKWNDRTNLTSIRDPETIVCRHFGESLFLGRRIGPAETFLDLGSGAGFPGVPVQLLLPRLRITLAESQNKKASFLRETVRSLGLHTEVWAARAEDLPPTRTFDVVGLRAVDNMELAVAEAGRRARQRVLILTSLTASEGYIEILANHGSASSEPIPATSEGLLFCASRSFR